MTTAWALLLLLGLAAALPQTQVLTYDQAIALAVNLYNQQRPSEFAFRLLEAEPQPNWDPNSKTAQVLKFSIKETVCPTSQTNNLIQCNFKEDGLDKDCSGIYSAQQQPPVFSIRCEDINQQDPYSESNQELNFTIKQTVCPVEEEFSMDECNFKENGLVRQCTGYYFLEERPPVAVLTCDTVEGSAKEEEKEEEKKDRPKRVKRFREFFRNVGDGIRDFIRNSHFVFGVNFRF